MPEPIKIAADITFNTKNAEKQLSSLGDTVSKSVNTSKQVREMADSFNRMSTRGMEKPIAKVVERIREGTKEISKFENYLGNVQAQMENLKSTARAGKKMPEMSSEYRKLIDDQKKYQEEIAKTQELLARGTKTVAGSTEGLKWGEQPKAVTRALNPEEIAEAEQYLTRLQGKLQGVESEMTNLEQRGDAFPKLSNSIEMAVIALNKASSQVVSLITSFVNMQSTAPQAASATEASLNGVYDAMTKLGEANVAQPIQAQASSVEQSMQRVAEATVEGVQQVQTQVQGVQQTVTQPVQAQIIDTTALQQQLSVVSSTLSVLVSTVTNQMQTLTNTITSGFQGIGSQVSAEMQNTITQLSARVSQLEAEVRRAEVSTRNVGTNAAKSSKVAVIAFAAIGKAVHGALGNVKKLISAVGSKLSSSFNKVQRSVDKAFSSRTFKRGLTTILKYGFGVRSLYFAFRRLRNGVKEGLQNLVKFEKAVGTSQNIDSVNKAITNLNSSLLYLKNAWASAFAPIVTAVMPLLTTLIDGLASVGNYIARFIGALTGQKTVLNAVKVNAEDYAESLDKTTKSSGGAAKAAKKLTDRLAAFDDLNVLGKDNDNDGAGGGAGNLLDNLPDPSEMFEYVEAQSNLADMLKQAWDEGDFSDLGTHLKDKIIFTLQSIDWQEIRETVDKGATSVGTFLEGFLGDPLLYEEIGRNAGELFNTITSGVETLLKHTKNIKFGENLGRGLNEFLKTTDFETAGKNVNELITQITDNIKDFVKTVDSEEVAKAITDFLNGLDVGDIVAKVNECVLEVGKLVLEVVGNVVVNWGEQLGDKWWKEATEGIETQIGDRTVTLTPEITADEDALGAFVDMIYTKIGEHFAQPNLKFSAVLASWISGSEVSEEDITLVAADLWSEFTNAFSQFNWGTVWDYLWNNDSQDSASEFKENMGECALSADEDMQTIRSAIKDTATDMGQFFLDIPAKAEEFKTSLSETWRGIASDIATKLVEIKTNATQKWEEIKSAVINKALGIKTKLDEVWKNIKDSAYEKFVLLRVAMVTIFNSIKDALRAPINGIISIVESMINKIINGVNSIVDKINSLPDIKFNNPFTGSEYRLGFSLPRLSNVSIPRLAQGAVIPPNNEFMAVLGDQSHGTNVEAPLDTIKQAVAEVLANNGNAEVVQLLQQLIKVVEDKQLTVGDKEIAQANARYSKQQQIVRGATY